MFQKKRRQRKFDELWEAYQKAPQATHELFASGYRYRTMPGKLFGSCYDTVTVYSKMYYSGLTRGEVIGETVIVAVVPNPNPALPSLVAVKPING